MTEDRRTHEQHQEVVNIMPDGSYLTVLVRDERDGGTHAITFKSNVMGQYKFDTARHDPRRKGVYLAARHVAEEYLMNVLNHTVLSKENWSIVNEGTAKQVLEDSGMDVTIEGNDE